MNDHERRLPRRFGFLMDPYPSLNLATETSLLCIDELLRRGHEVFWLHQEDLDLAANRVLGLARRVRSVNPFATGDIEEFPLATLDALVVRKDPPFDSSYLHLTYLLDFLARETLVINSPAALRSINEKLYTLNWPEHCPDTLVSMNADRLAAFVRRHGRAVIKPLDDCSGRGIHIVDADREDLGTLLEHELEAVPYLLAQAFIEGVRHGDKRVYVLDGEPVGWVNRLPQSPDRLANIHQGALCRPTHLTPGERGIVNEIGPAIAKLGVLMAGLDFIDGRLTEINITSPSAVRQINEVEGIRLELRLVDALLEQVETQASPRLLAGNRPPSNVPLEASVS